MSSWFNGVKHLFQHKALKRDVLQSFKDMGITSRRWWGTYQVEAGQSRFWRVGNVVICVDRFMDEWHVAGCPVGKINGLKDEDQDGGLLSIPFEDLSFKTFTFKTQAEITLKPVLPNMPLASELEQHLYIPGGESILLYVSSPVWVRIETGDKTKIILDEIPTYALSETWVSHKNNTMDGEVCYSGHTHCSPHLKDVPSGPDRIISPLLITNKAEDTLILEKISVPLPYLSVYSDAENFLWTEQLYVNRESNENPEVEFAKGPPKALDEIYRLTPPRRDSNSHSGLKRLFVSNFVGS
jgi:hypothetical protein